MIDAVVFAMMGLTLLFAIAIAFSRKLLNAVIMLALLFTASSLLFISIGHSFIGLLQLLVLVGGISTYLIVAISDSSKIKNSTNIIAYIIFAVAISYLLMVAVYNVPSGTFAVASISQMTAEMLSASPIIAYLIAFLLSGCSFASVLALKRLTKLVV